jgi:ribosomal protein S18 acetylase RimI-like enzyme
VRRHHAGLDGATALHVAGRSGPSGRRGRSSTSCCGRRCRGAAPAGCACGSCRPPSADDAEAPTISASCPSGTCSRCASPSPFPPRSWRRPPGGHPALPAGPDDEAWLDHQQPGLRRPPRTGRMDPRRPARAHGADWFDLEGFLVADDAAPTGTGLIGSCWTKVHRTSEPVLGEIYVISVDPGPPQPGWGRALTVAGLQWLAAQGVTVGMLYTTPPTRPPWRSTNRSASRRPRRPVVPPRRPQLTRSEHAARPAPVPMARPTP